MRTILSDIAALNGRTFHTSPYSDPEEYLKGEISILTNARHDYLPNDTSFRAIHVLRNPLSVILSAYYSHLATHPVDGWPELEVQRKLLSESSYAEGIWLTVKYMEPAADGVVGPLRALADWNFDDQRIENIRFEDLNQDPSKGFKGIFENVGFKNLQYPDFYQYSFKALTNGREVGQVDNNSHYRSGRADAWREELPADVIAYVRENYRTILGRFYPESL